MEASTRPGLAGRGYSIGMAQIRLVDIDRPTLVTALVARGMTVSAGRHQEGSECDALIFRVGTAHRAVRTVAGLAGCATMALVDSGDDADDDAVIAALDAGIDDAVPVATSDAVIAARTAALLRRTTRSTMLVVGGLTIDLIGRRAIRDGQPIALLPREFKLLEVLARHAGATVPRAMLLRTVCGLGFDPGTNVLEVHVSRLRARLDHGFAAPMLLTDKGIGYRLVDPRPISGDAAIDAVVDCRRRHRPLALPER